MSELLPYAIFALLGAVIGASFSTNEKWAHPNEKDRPEKFIKEWPNAEHYHLWYKYEIDWPRAVKFVPLGAIALPSIYHVLVLLIFTSYVETY